MNILTEYPIVVNVDNFPYTGSDSLSATVKAVRPTTLLGSPSKLYAVNHPEMFNMTNSPIGGGSPIWIAASPELGSLLYKISTNEVEVNMADLSNISTTPTDKIAVVFKASNQYYLRDTFLVKKMAGGILPSQTSSIHLIMESCEGRPESYNYGTVGGTVTNTGNITFNNHSARTSGGAAVLNGSNYLNLPSVTLGAQNFTIEAWLNGQGCFWGIDTGSGGPRKIALSAVREGPLYGWTWGVGQTGQVLGGTSGIVPATGWYHVAFVRNGNGYTWYINGQPAGTGSITINYTTSTDYHKIGWAPDLDTYTGEIGDIKLTIGTAVYTEAFTPSTTAIVSGVYATDITTQIGSVSAGTINVSEDRTLIATTGETGVSVNNTSDLTSVGTVISTVSINSAISSDGTKVFVGSTDNTAGIYRISDGVQALSLSAKQNPAYSSIIDRVAFATSVEDGAFTIEVYNISTFDLVTTLTVPSLVKYLKFTYDGDELLAGFDSTTVPIKRYNTSDWSEITDRGDLTDIIYNPKSVICMIPN